MDISGNQMSAPLTPASPQTHSKMAARITTFHLKSGEELQEDFTKYAEKADYILMHSILPLAQSNPGFLACQRLVDVESGEFKIVSFWRSEEDCESSRTNDEYYARGLLMLRESARHGMFKTEHFEAWTLHPSDAPLEIRTTPYALTTMMQLDQERGADLANQNVDEHFMRHMEECKSKAGFVGAQRLAGLGDAKGTYICILFWDSYEALRASSKGTAQFDRFLGSFGVSSDGVPTGCRQFLEPSTDLSTRQYLHLHYEPPVSAMPWVRQDTLLSTTFQLAAISFGVGVFAMPSVFSKLGWGTGTILLVMWAAFSDFGMQIILKVAEGTGAGTYEECLYNSFGASGRILALVSLAISTFTANCAHMQFVSTMFVEMNGKSGGLMETLVGPDKATQNFTAIVIFGGLALPLCFKRKLSDLRFVSLGVVIFCLIASAIVCLKSLGLMAHNGTHNTDKVLTVQNLGSLLDGAPVAAFGFSSVAELFHVRAEMSRPEMLPHCAHLASIIVATLYMIVGFVGAFAFDTPGSNVLQNFPGNHLIAFIRLGIIMMITLLYPIINFPCCQAIDALVAGRYGTPSRFRWNLFSILCLVAVLCIDTFVKTLDAVFGLSGALGLGLIAYLLPCGAGLAVSFGLVRVENPGISAYLKRPATIAMTLVVFAIGLIMTFGSTIWIIYGVATNKQS